jgi:hypothetical protein
LTDHPTTQALFAGGPAAGQLRDVPAPLPPVIAIDTAIDRHDHDPETARATARALYVDTELRLFGRTVRVYVASELEGRDRDAALVKAVLAPAAAAAWRAGTPPVPVLAAERS